jgi:hypothetical protein
MSIRTFTPHPFNPKYVISVSIIMTALVALLYVAMLQFVFPNEGNIISVYVPARSGGKDFVITPDEFMLWGGIALGVTVAMAVGVITLVRLKKELLALIFAMSMTTLAGLYLAIYVGNSFDELWGGWWSVPGVLGMLIIALGLQAPLVLMLMQVSRDQAKK